MPQSVICHSCRKTLKAPDKLAGKRVRCPSCQTVVSVPAIPDAGPTPEPGDEAEAPPAVAARAKGKVPREPEFDDDFDWFQPLEQVGDASPLRDDDIPDLDELPELPAPVVRRPKQKRDESDAVSPVMFARQQGSERDKREQPTPRKSRSDSESNEIANSHRLTGSWRDSLHWVLALAMLPLALSIVLPGPSTPERLIKVLEENPQLQNQLEGVTSLDELFAVLPGHRFPGAHLERGTLFHWGYAVASAAAFLLLLLAMFPGSQAGAQRLLWTGVITGTVGIVLLLGFQFVAEWTQHFNLRGRSIMVLFFYVVKFIGFSYRCATDGDTGFVLSFMGFTCGVGLCEELCKALPVAIYLGTAQRPDWRAACLVGLASGIGFGVSEGIMYSSDYYNGIAPGLTYLVRFASCVALHAVWASSVALLMFANQDYVPFGTAAGDFEWSDVANFILFYLAIAMVLHGLYDTLLKQDLPLGALAIAAASFGWWAWLLQQQRAAD